MPAMAATSNQRDSVAAALGHAAGQPAAAVDEHQHDEAHRESGQQRRPFAAAFLGDTRARQHHREHDHRHQHRHAHQLDDRGHVAGLRRHAVARTHHLRHVVDRRAEKHPGGTRVEPEPLREHRVDDHRQRRQRRHADHGEQRRPLLQRMVRQRRGQRQRRRGAADRGGTAAEQAEQALEAHQLGHDHRHADRQHHRDHDDGQRLPAQFGHLAERDAQAEQRHAEAQHRAGGEFDARLAGAVAGQEVHRQPSSSANSITGAP